MSQIPNTQPTSTLQRPRFNFDSTTSDPSVGMNGNFQATEPTVAGDQSAAQLSGAIRTFAGTVGNLGDRQANIDANTERQQLKAEAAAEKARIAMENATKNTAAMDAQQSIPELLNGIKNGTIVPTEKDAGDPETFINRIISEKNTGLGDTYDNEYKRVAVPRLLNAVYQKMDADKKAAIIEQKNGLFSRIAMTEDPEQLDSVLQDARKQPGMAEHVDEVAAKALINFAKNGNQGMVDNLKTALGANEIGSQDYADRLLMVAKGKAETERNQQFANEVATIFDQSMDDQSSPEDIKAQVEESANNLGIEPRIVAEHLRGVNAAIQRKREQAIAQSVYDDVANKVQLQTTQTVAQVLQDAGDSTSPGIVTGFGKRLTFEPIAGLPTELGGTEARKNGFISEARRQTRVDVNNIDTKDERNVNAWTMYYRGMNNSGVVDDEIKNRLLSLDLNAQDPTKPTTPSPKNIAAAQTYLLLHQINPTATAAMVDGNPQAKAFYDNVVIQMKTPGAVMDQTLINRATAVASVDPKDKTQPTDKDYQAIQARAPGLTPSALQYAVRTYRGQLDHGGTIKNGINTDALAYATDQANNRTVELWQPWAGWANPIVPFTSSNNSPNRPRVDLGTLAMAGPEAASAIGTAMEGLLTKTAVEINKMDPRLKVDPSDLRLDYAGNGVWNVQGIPVGKLTADQEGLFHVTHDQILEQMGKDAVKQNPQDSLDVLTKNLAEAKRYQKQLEEFQKSGGKAPTTNLLPNGGMSVSGMSSAEGLISVLETKIKVRQLIESRNQK